MLSTASSNGKTVKTTSKEEKELQQTIRNRAKFSLAVLGMGFVRNGSGRFLNLRAEKIIR